MIMIVKHLLPFLILILIINTEHAVWCARMYDLNDDAHGLRFAGNDKFIISAFNAYELYALRSLLISSNKECIVPYPHSDLYVYSLATVDLPNITTNNSELAAFVQIAENMTSSSDSLTNVVLSLFVVNISSTACAAGSTYVNMTEIIIWTNQVHQEYMLIKVDPQQKYVYVFTDLAVFSYDLATNTMDQLVFMNDTVFWQNLTKISVRSFDLTNGWALVAAYASESNAIRSRYYALLLELRPLHLLAFQRFHDYSVDRSETNVLNL